MLLNDQNEYGLITKTLHWLIALCVLAMIILGFFVGATPAVTATHKGLGLIVLVLMIVRIVFIHCNPGPKLPASISKIEAFASKSVKYGLYLTLIIMPLSGWIFASAANHPPHFFGVNVPFPFVAGSSAFLSIFHTVHIVFVWVLISLLVLHIAGVLKHQCIDKIKFIKRMALCPKPKYDEE